MESDINSNQQYSRRDSEEIVEFPPTVLDKNLESKACEVFDTIRVTVKHAIVFLTKNSLSKVNQLEDIVQHSKESWRLERS